MAINIISRNFNTRRHPSNTSFLLANQANRITEQLTFTVSFNYSSNSNELCKIVSENSVQVLGSEWSLKGLNVGDSITLEFSYIDSAGSPVPFNQTTTVLSINSDTFVCDYDFGTFLVGSIFPQQAGTINNSVLSFVNNTSTSPETIEFYHNLVENDQQGSRFSLFDGEVNRFEIKGVDLLSVNDSVDVVQIGNKSGGSYDIGINRLSRLPDVGLDRQYRLNLVYDNYLKFDDSDLSLPQWYEQNNSLKPYLDFLILPQDNNPNANLQLVLDSQLGNVGWVNESYNQGVNDFTVAGVTFTDNSGSTLNTVDYTQSTNISVQLTSANPFNTNVEFQFFLIPNQNTVKNNINSMADNISLVNVFYNGGTASIVSKGLNNRKLSVTNVSTFLIGNSINLGFTLNPTSEFTNYIESLPANERLFAIDVNVENVGFTENNNNAVALRVASGELQKADIPNQPYDKMTFQGFFNHANELSGVSEVTYNGCAEDDMLYNAKFNLEENVAWEKLNLSIQVVRNSDNVSFDLFTKSIGFDAYPMVNGKIQVNFLEVLNQFLDIPERNKLELKLTGNDSGGLYEVELIWSLMANWRYWIAEVNALNDFYDINLPNDGKNKEWMRYLRLNGYSVKLNCELVRDGVGYYFGSGINLKDYDASSDITTSLEYYDSNGIQQIALLPNELMTVKAVHTLNSGTWNQNDVWGWLATRPFESEERKQISTKWNWTSNNLPFKPSAGQTKAKLSFPNPNVAHVEALIDTNLIGTNSTIVARIETPADPSCISPIDWLFDYLEANAQNNSDYFPLFVNAMNGTDLSNTNVCCPTCTVEDKVSRNQYELYAIGKQSDVDALVNQLSGEPAVCCTDVYDLTSGCTVNFKKDIDDTTALTNVDLADIQAYIPMQINTYSDTNVLKFKERLESLTNSQGIRGQIWDEIFENGFRFICANGTKFLGRL